MTTAEQRRIDEANRGVPWRAWGPYLAERQWGTVREDHSDDGDAWSYVSHDDARSWAYRWGEDGIAGVSDELQRLCLAITVWNGRDPILKERLFGLTNTEGNHGEDVKDYAFHVDNVPSHAYMRYLYKYPVDAFPYDDLVATNARRGRDEMEYELIDTGVLANGRYVDVEIEYAKAAPDDLVMRVTVHNRSDEHAAIHLLPTLWFRNTWSCAPFTARPEVRGDAEGVVVDHPELGRWRCTADPGAEWLFCDNDTNVERFAGRHLPMGVEPRPFPKDAFHARIVDGRVDATNPDRVGTKAAAHQVVQLAAGASAAVHLRLVAEASSPSDAPSASDALDVERIDALIAERRAQADEFYLSLTPPSATADEALVMRQALAGMLWGKQTYLYDVDRWLRDRNAHPLRPDHRPGSRNASWFHLDNHDVISMPDIWEYPWYAAWDLAFHCIPLMMVDPWFAKRQLALMLSPRYLHPSGQIPAYEWNFGDVNPPVHAFATLLVHSLDDELSSEPDIEFLEEAFERLRVNFTWWLNRKDPAGKGLFEGGFLGLDNIGVFDRSRPLPTGGRLEQADGTAWMALFSINMVEIALVLAEHDEGFEEAVVEFFERFFWIAAAVDPAGERHDEMWDEQEGFFYDVLRRPDGTGMRLEVRSLVGLLPMCAVAVIEESWLERFPAVRARIAEFVDRNGDLVSMHDPRVAGVEGRRLLSLVDERKLRRLLARMLDEERFLGPYGIRSLSKWHLDHPYVFEVDGVVNEVRYEPAESTSAMFGGNSNWRGPVWFPMNVLIVRALLQHYQFYGDEFTVECPTGSGMQMTLFEVAAEISRRLAATFLVGDDGRRPVYGGADAIHDDPYWRDLVAFYEYFHGDDGAGLGAMHQTGWTGTVAKLIQIFASLDAPTLLADGGRPLARPYRRLRHGAADPI
jgi:hypothetical protein